MPHHQKNNPDNKGKDNICSETILERKPLELRVSVSTMITTFNATTGSWESSCFQNTKHCRLFTSPGHSTILSHAGPQEAL